MKYEASVKISREQFIHWRSLMSIENMQTQLALTTALGGKPHDSIFIGSAVFDDKTVIDLYLISENRCYSIDPVVKTKSGVMADDVLCEMDLENTVSVADNTYVIKFDVRPDEAKLDRNSIFAIIDKNIESIRHDGKALHETQDECDKRIAHQVSALRAVRHLIASANI